MSAPHSRVETLWLRPEEFGFHPMHEKQLQFLHLPHPNGYYVGGMGSGKTDVLLYWAIQEAMDPRNRHRTVGLGAPTFKIADELHRARLLYAFDAFAQKHGFGLLEYHDKGRQAFHLLGGGRIYQFSYDNDITRNAGLEFCSMGLDEVDKDSGGDAAYGYLSTRVRGAGTGRIRAVSTPSGYQGCVKLFLDGRANPETRHMFGLVHSPSRANPMMTPQKLAVLRAQMSAAEYKQNIEAEILRPMWSVWPEFNRGRHLVNWHPVSGRQIEWAAAVDWGYNCAYVVAAAKATGLYPHDKDVDAWVVFGQAVHEEAAEEAPVRSLEQMRREIGCDPIGIFPDNSHPHLNSKIRRLFPGVPVKPKSKQHEVWPSVQRVRAWLDPADESPARLAFWRGLDTGEMNIIRCAENYKRRRVQGVILDEVAPIQPWEHGADCIRYLVEGLEGGTGPGLYVVGAV